VAKQSRFARAAAALRKHALSYPDANEEFPWGHSAFKINGKTFLFTYVEGELFSLSMKLPETGNVALALPFAEPTGYGLGKSGWVTARFEGKAEIPVDMLLEWVDESFRAIAPKRVLVKLTDRRAASSPAKPRKKRNEQP
jgi:predicted DNA-binding protein (MmcQ/YjbR family)